MERGLCSVKQIRCLSQGIRRSYEGGERRGGDQVRLCLFVGEEEGCLIVVALFLFEGYLIF